MNFRIGLGAIFFAVFNFTTLAADAVCVSSNKTYLRSEATTKSELSWTVGKYMPLKLVGRKGNWIRVKDVDNETHWVHGGNVTQTFRCMVVKAPYALLRTGPGVNFKKAAIEVVDKYTPFKLLGKKDGWAHVQDDYGKDYWIFANNLWEPIITQRVDF